MHELGLNEFITSNEKEYEEKALYYARNRVELKNIKNFLNSIKKDSSLSNPKEYTLDLEKNYSELVSKIEKKNWITYNHWIANLTCLLSL